MSRSSVDQHDARGALVDGFDYALQVWVVAGVVQRCGHPDAMQCRCNGRRFAGQRLADVVQS